MAVLQSPNLPASQTHINGLNNVWIVKPAGKSRGRGIRLFNDLDLMFQYIKGEASHLGQSKGKTRGRNGSHRHWYQQKRLIRLLDSSLSGVPPLSLPPCLSFPCSPSLYHCPLPSAPTLPHSACSFLAPCLRSSRGPAAARDALGGPEVRRETADHPPAQVRHPAVGAGHRLEPPLRLVLPGGRGRRRRREEEGTGGWIKRGEMTVCGLGSGSRCCKRGISE